MRCTLAAIGIWLTGCSVYDDALLATQPPVIVPASAAIPEDSDSPDASAPDVAAPSADACAHGASAEYCAQLPALTRLPAIDGALECGLSLSPMQPLGWKGPAAPEKRASLSAAWHHDGLYAFVEVHGQPVIPHPPAEPVFCGDAVELYVDADAEVDDAGTYDDTGTMQFVIAAPRAGTAATGADAWRFTQGVSQGTWITKALRVSPLADGYSVEAFITAADLGLWQWSPSQRVGFSVVIDVASAAAGPEAADTGCTAEVGQFFLRLGAPRGSCPGEPWCDAAAFCDAVLLP